MWKILSGHFAVGGLVSTMVFGCSSSNSSSTCPPGYTCTPGDAQVDVASRGVDAASTSDVVSGADAVSTDDGGGNVVGTDDGTTGIPCTSDSACQNPSGPGVNVCSSDYGGSILTVANVASALFATPVCMLPITTSASGNCDPGTDPGTVHFCDGPDAPSSPGLCVPNDFSAPMTNQGICYPLCTFTSDGSAATGCNGHNACLPVTYVLDSATNTALGIGYCASACQQDSDCSALGVTYSCETDTGYCTQTPLKRTKAQGAACSTGGSSNDLSTGACLCSAGASNAGYCSSVCVIGGTACPEAWVCDSGEPTTLSFGVGEPSFSLTKQNSGLLGICSPSCSLAGGGVEAGTSVEAGAGSEAGAALVSVCPGTSTCATGTVVGPDCVSN
jgi:hypothetical protein